VFTSYETQRYITECKCEFIAIVVFTCHTCSLVLTRTIQTLANSKNATIRLRTIINYCITCRLAAHSRNMAT